MVFAAAMSGCTALAWGGVDVCGFAESCPGVEMIVPAIATITVNIQRCALLRTIRPSNKLKSATFAAILPDSAGSAAHFLNDASFCR
jgi:hypothetical protein